jgi:SpoU rRNA methylase family enzyme
MCSGSTTHIINDNKVVLEKGELLFLSMNAVQEILPAKENDVAVNFIILPEFFNKALNMIEMEESPLKDFIIESLVGKKGNIAIFILKLQMFCLCRILLKI